MAENGNYRITARVDGKGQKTFNFGEETVQINAAENTVYQIEEIGFSSIPDNIVFSRVGNDLWVMPEGKETPQAIIKNYFSTKDAKFGAVGVDGSLYSYGIENLNVAAEQAPAVEHTLATEVAPAATAEPVESAAASPTKLSIPVISTAALAIGGIAVAAGAGSHSSGHNDNHASEKSQAEASHGAAPLGVSEAPAEQDHTDTAFLDATKAARSSTVLPEISVFHDAGSFVKGSAHAGDLVAQAQSSEHDQTSVTYYLNHNPNEVYAINHSTGAITLTKAGAALINAGEDLPDLEVIVFDGANTRVVTQLDMPETSIATTKDSEAWVYRGDHHSSDILTENNHSFIDINASDKPDHEIALHKESAFIDDQPNNDGVHVDDLYHQDNQNLDHLLDYETLYGNGHNYGTKNLDHNEVSFNNADRLLENNHGTESILISPLNADALLNFNFGKEDNIQLDHNIFTNFALGYLENSTAAESHSDDVHYDSYDLNANNGHSMSKFVDHFNDEVNASRIL